jgi:hypothetical protein
MALDPADLDQVKNLIQNSVTAAIAAACPRPAQVAPVSRSAAEVGSPEFAEDRTQINSLNNKWIFESAMDRYWSRSARSDDHYADLQSRSLASLDNLLEIGKKVSQKFFSSIDLNERSRMGFDYTTTYDLSNPNTLGTSDVVRGAVDPQNRAIDNATASLSNIPSMVQSAVAQAFTDNTVFSDAVKGAVADAMNGTVPTLEAAIGAAVAAALANTPVKPTAA